MATLGFLVAACAPSSVSDQPAAAPSPPTTTPPPVYSSLPVLTTSQPAGIPTGLGRWRLAGRTEVPGPYSDQGLATVSRPGGRTEIVYDGTHSVTASLLAQGWNHVGDPDGWDGWVVTPFQGGPGSRAKMFQVTSPGGAVIRSVHALDRGETANNSFAAVSPDGLWTLSAEWGVETRLLVFPTPVVNPAAPAGQPLRSAGNVTLDQAVTGLQGCGFMSATSLICTDQSHVVELDLDHPVGQGGRVSASVRVLGPVPEAGGCPGPYEPEGVDVDRALGQLRIEVSQPGVCSLLTQVYEYNWR